MKCACGGASGSTICKYPVVCVQCHLCKRGCLANPNCSTVYADENKEGMTLRKQQTKRNYNEMEIPSKEIFAKRQIKVNQTVSHCNLSLPCATISDLAKAYGRTTFCVPNAKATIFALQDRISLKGKINNDDDTSDNNFLRSYFNPIQIILDSSIRIFTGGEAESNELKNLFLNEEFEGWHDSLLIKNAKDILNKTSLLSETNCAIKALLVKTLGDKVAKKNGIFKGSSVSRANFDFDNLVLNGKMSPITKKLPRGKSGKITDAAIENALMSIVANSSTTAWSMRTHVIQSDRIIKTKSNDLEMDNDKKISIPAFHRKISKSEMFYHYCTKYQNIANHLSRSAFFALTKTVTITEDKSMRALDYNITDLLHEQQ